MVIGIVGMFLLSRLNEVRWASRRHRSLHWKVEETSCRKRGCPCARSEKFSDFIPWGLSQRQIAVSCAVGQATVSDYLKAAEAAGLKWPDIADWGEDRLLQAAAPSRGKPGHGKQSPEPDYAGIRHELQTHKHVTLQLLWEEYREKNPNGYRYSRFCDLYRGWLRGQEVVLRHEHRAGETL